MYVIMYTQEAIAMINTNITNFRKNIFSMLEQTIKFNEPVNITTKDGNAVVMSEEDYNNVMATFEIYNNPSLHEKIMKGMDTPVTECLSEDDVQW